MIQIKEETKIENPRRYETWEVEHLELLLKAGTPIHRDPRRKNFYEVEGEAVTFYVHVSPVSGNVVLLAKWVRQPQECYANSGELVA